MAKERDYRAEYARRKASGLAKGLSLSQVRGHPAIGEKPISGRVVLPKYDRQLEEGLKAVRKGKSLRLAASEIHASPERLRNYLKQTGVVEKEKGRWKVGQDSRQRELLIYSNGASLTITVSGYEPAFQIGRYMAAVNQFLTTNDPENLAAFVGQSIEDVKGRHYVFETRPNAIYKLNYSAPKFEDIYRIVT